MKSCPRNLSASCFLYTLPLLAVCCLKADADGGLRPSALELATTCETLFGRGELEAAQQACRRAERESNEAWPRPFLAEARILSRVAQRGEHDGDNELVALASAQAVDRLRRAIAASPMDDLTDFQAVSALEFTGSLQTTKILDELRFGDLPGLTRQPLHSLESVAGALDLQAALPSIIAEFNLVAGRVSSLDGDPKNAKTKRNNKKKTSLFGWHPAGAYSESHDAALLEEGGTWDNLGLFSYGVRHEENCNILFPQLCGLIESLPRIRSAHIGHVVLSRVRAGSKIRSHSGAPNTRVTIQCPLELPITGVRAKGATGHNGTVNTARPIVGDATVEYKTGECFVFDDNIEHRVEVDELDGDVWRTVLIAHAWHPEVRAAEMLASVALSANMDPVNRESVLKHVYAETAAEWRKEALQLRAQLAGDYSLPPNIPQAQTFDQSDL